MLITGGDALMLSNTMLDWLVSELDKIDHVEIKRIGTRTLSDFTSENYSELCSILKSIRQYILIPSLIHLWRRLLPGSQKGL